MHTEEQDILMNGVLDGTCPTNPDGTNGDTTNTPTAPVSGVKTPIPSCPATAIERLQARIKDAREELAAIYNDDDFDDKALEAADNISRRIASFKKHLDALTDKADKMRPVNFRDVPRFQIEGQFQNFKDYPSFSSLEHYFSSYESVMYASGNDIEKVWKQYMPVSVHFSHHTWMENSLMQCTSWASAKALFVKHYGAPVKSMELILRLFNMKMKATDTLQEYTKKFVKNVQEAGFDLGSNTIAKFYQCSLLKKNQQMMNQMLVKKDANHCWTTNEIYECVLPFFLADEQARGADAEVTNHKGKRKAGTISGNPSKSPKMAHTGFFCAKHGGNKANHNAVDCRSQVKNFVSENKPNRATTSAPRATNSSSSSGRSFPNICFHCKKPREPGHLSV